MMKVSQNERDEVLAEDVEIIESSSAVIPEEDDKQPSIVVLVAGIVAYSIISIAVVYFNWWLFRVFPYPVFISWGQQIFGTSLFCLGSHSARYCSSLRPVFPPLNLKWSAARTCAKLSIAFVLTIGLANLCLQRTLISTYQVARSLTLFFILLLSYFILKERHSWPVLGACAMMVFGFMIGSLDPATLSLGGLLAGGLSSFFQSLYNVLIKSCIPAVDGNQQLLLFYNISMSLIFFVPMVLIVEGFKPWNQAFNPAEPSNKTLIWVGVFISGMLGTALNMTQYFVISITSPLTFNIAALAKSLIQSLGGILFFGDTVSPASLSGLLLSFGGSGWYTWVKHKEAKAKELAQQQEGDQTARSTAPLKEIQLHSPVTVAETPEGEWNETEAN